MFWSQGTAPSRDKVRQPLETSLRLSNVGVLASNTWGCRELLRYLITRNLRTQYKQSFLGYAWILVNPFVQFLVFSFVFSTILHNPSQGGVPYSLFLFVGLVPWVFFTNALSSATDCVVGAANLITVVYFPRELLVEAAIATRIVDWLAGIVILVPLLIYYGQPIDANALWALVLFALYSLFTLGISLPLAALNLYFRDIRYLVGIGLTLWFFLTPVVYSVETVPAKYRDLYELNPHARFIDSFRYTLLQGGKPPTESILLALIVALLALTFGYFLFKRMEPTFADRI